MDLGERISPSSVSNIRKALFNVEPLSDARTPLAAFFSILGAFLCSSAAINASETSEG